jgi:hypothetical protein
MARHLNLVKSDFEKLEKRVFPRFPFCYLTFKASSECGHVFEIKDISSTGMQLGLKNGTHKWEQAEQIHGQIHWHGMELDIAGNIKWTTDKRLGVEFSTKPTLREKITNFLSVKNFANSLKPIHKMNMDTELPAKLKYWLRADGPVEIFVWQHSDGELARFEILIMENFIEWADGQGLKTGRIMSKRDIDTPLITEDEFVFKMDSVIDDAKIDNAKNLVRNISTDNLSAQTLDFIHMKLGGQRPL